MGGAEGTKLDLDFMEMERVRLNFCQKIFLAHTKSLRFFFFSSAPFCPVENRRHSGIGRRSSSKN